MLANQIASLIQALGMEPVTFYGCSSAGLAVLSLLARKAGPQPITLVFERK